MIYRSGSYIETEQPPLVDETIWAIVNLEITDGGAAYQELLHTLGATAS